ncbi:oligosaccharide repeat unit polymerase, partial [Methanothermococcus sp. SCGC AD-155-E23]|nr:oligosaccharide repeat unit polymerase [Methanothermococcus sp. SCGC AD-155-E23]
SKDPLRLISTGALVYGGMCNIFYFLVAFILLLLLGYKAGILILFTSFLL